MNKKVERRFESMEEKLEEINHKYDRILDISQIQCDHNWGVVGINHDYYIHYERECLICGATEQSTKEEYLKEERQRVNQEIRNLQKIRNLKQQVAGINAQITSEKPIISNVVTFDRKQWEEDLLNLEDLNNLIDPASWAGRVYVSRICEFIKKYDGKNEPEETE